MSMLLLKSKKNYGHLLIFAAIATSLVIAPYFSYEAVNPPKLLILATFGFAFGSLIIYTLSDNLAGNLKTTTIFALLFLVILITTWVLSPGNPVAKFYGINGRHTGVLTYLSLLFIFLLAAMVSDLNFLRLVVKGITLTGLVSIFYAVLQILDLDPFPWQNNETWVQTFFANPNFFAAFLSFSAVPTVAYILFGEKNKKTISAALVYLATSLFILKQTLTYQGFFALILTSGVIFSIWIIKRWHSIYLKISIFLIFVLAVVGIILDLFQKAPWVSIFYKASLSTRGDYWRSAWQIFLDHPFVGVGLDQFRNYYERYRDVPAAQNREGALLGDAVHNVFLDILVGGGILLLLSYLALLVLCAVSIVRYIQRTEKISFYYISVLGIFMAYLTQSVISINHLGLAIWGWLSAGALIGFEISTRDLLPSKNSKVEIANKTSRQRAIRKRGGVSHVMTSCLGALLGFIVSVPVIKVNHEIVVAYKESSPVLLYQAANKSPKDTWRMSSTAETLRNMGYSQDAYLLVQEAIKFDPESVIPWKVLNDFPNLPSDIRTQVEKKILQLDPLNELTPSP
jgi:O-antigen ligase